MTSLTKAQATCNRHVLTIKAVMHDMWLTLAHIYANVSGVFGFGQR